MEPRDALLYSHVIGFYPQILGKSPLFYYMETIRSQFFQDISIHIAVLRKVRIMNHLP